MTPDLADRTPRCGGRPRLITSGPVWATPSRHSAVDEIIFPGQPLRGQSLGPAPRPTLARLLMQGLVPGEPRRFSAAHNRDPPVGPMDAKNFDLSKSGPYRKSRPNFSQRKHHEK